MGAKSREEFLKMIAAKKGKKGDKKEEKPMKKGKDC